MKDVAKSFWKEPPKFDELHFTDLAGAHWSISERDARTVPGSMGERCLICMTDAAVRRIWEYPRDWRLLPQGDLQRLVDVPRGGQTPPSRAIRLKAPAA